MAFQENDNRTFEIVEALYQLVLDNSRQSPNGKCIECRGTNQSGYVRIEMTVNKHRHRLGAHQIVLMHFLRVTCLPGREYNNTVSHLCHNKKCVNVKHLMLERQGVNNTRIACNRARHCYGHYLVGYGKLPNCIFIQRI